MALSHDYALFRQATCSNTRRQTKIRQAQLQLYTNFKSGKRSTQPKIPRISELYLPLVHPWAVKATNAYTYSMKSFLLTKL